MPWIFPVSADYWKFNWFFLDWDEEHTYQHQGLDIGAEKGSPIIAPTDFHVINAGWSDAGYGNFVMGETEDGLVLIFGHLVDTPMVDAGDDVMAGDQLGNLGSTGNSSGPHLHFEIRQDGHTIDPLPFIQDAGSGEGDYQFNAGDGDNEAGKPTNPLDSVKNANSFFKWVANIDYKKIFGNVVVVIGGGVLIYIGLQSLTTTAAGKAIGEAIGKSMATVKSTGEGAA